MSLKDSLPFEKNAGGVGGLGTLGEPLQDFHLVDLHRCRLRERVVVAHLLDESPVPRRTGIRDDEAIEGPLLGPHPPESDLYHQYLLDEFSRAMRLFAHKPPIPRRPLRPLSPGRPGRRLPRPRLPSCLSTCSSCSRARRTRLTSATSVPLPRAMRRRRE